MRNKLAFILITFLFSLRICADVKGISLVLSDNVQYFEDYMLIEEMFINVSDNNIYFPKSFESLNCRVSNKSKSEKARILDHGSIKEMLSMDGVNHHADGVVFLERIEDYVLLKPGDSYKQSVVIMLEYFEDNRFPEAFIVSSYKTPKSKSLENVWWGSIESNEIKYLNSEKKIIVY